MCKGPEVRGQDVEETEECGCSTGKQGKEWSGDACRAMHGLRFLDLHFGPRKLTERLFSL